MRFYLTSLGKDRFIFGYPFLYAFNPTFDWRSGNMLGPKTQIQTIGFKKDHKRLRQVQFQAIRALGRRPKTGEATYYRRATTSQNMAHKWQAKQGKEAQQGLPKEYQHHWKVFDKQLAQRFPPSCIEDMKIHLHPDAPRTINCKVYPLTHAEEDYV